MNTKEILDEMLSLPTEQRAFFADFLLKSLNPPTSENDKKWAEAVKFQLQEIRIGKLKLLNGVDVVNKIWTKYAV